MGWDVNVHVNLQKQLILRTRGVGWGGDGVGCQRSCELAEAVDATHTRGGVGGGMGWDVNVHVNLQMMMI